ncbi:hypothetical protein G9A89_005000 [Geosiphon pyriformis]|nr:hypothetical protein G9A89_005000 [Geosiphon pyriformis]
MSGEESQKYVQACNKSAEACNNCAEKMKEEGCAKQCRTNAELANCTSKLISLNSPQAPKLAELTVESAKLCASMCVKRITVKLVLKPQDISTKPWASTKIMLKPEKEHNLS